MAKANAGKAEVLIDGASQGTIDTYSRYDSDVSVYYSGRVSGTHTIQVRVHGTKNPSSSDYWVHLDFIDAWDGTQMPQETFEKDSPRVLRSGNWVWSADGTASGGHYLRDGLNLWFPFTGNTVTYQALATSWAGQVEVRIDGVPQGQFSLYNPTTITRTFAFDLAAGPHVLQVKPYQGRATLDALIVPPEELPPPEATLSQDSIPAAPVLLGDSITYVLRYTNTGEAPLVSAAITDAVPFGTTLQPAGGHHRRSGGDHDVPVRRRQQSYCRTDAR